MFDTASAPELSDTATKARQWARLADVGLSHLAHVDVEELDPSDLRDITLQLEHLRRFTDAAEAHLLAELDDRRVTDLLSGLTTSKWLAERARLPAGVARQRLVVAKKLAAMLPTVDEALSAGRLGFDHARVFADVVNDRNHAAMEPLLDDLIAASAGTVFNRWRDDVTALAAYLDPDGDHDPANDLARNRLTLSPSDDVMLLRGELAGERALSVHDTLNAVADELFHQYRRDHETFPELGVPDRATLLALALEEVCRRALAVDRASTQAPKVEATLTIHAAHGSCSCGGDDPSVLAAAWSIESRLGLPLPATTLPTFLCDPVLYAALVDSLGVPIDMGRATRTTTPAQRRALTVRDGGCVFPGCDCPAAWTDAHHIRQWTRDEGPTDLDNVILLCRRHHRVAHRNGWNVELDGDGWTRWTTPSGDARWGQRHHHQRAGP